MVLPDGESFGRIRAGRAASLPKADCNSNIWATPASRMATAIGKLSKSGLFAKISGFALVNAGTHKVPPMRPRFNKIGEAAPPKNLSWAFVIAAHKATSDIIGKYGIDMRANVTAASNLSGVSEKPGANRPMIRGIKISAKITMKLNTSSRMICTSAASIKAADFPASLRK